jgi:thymidine phosphorylase
LPAAGAGQIPRLCRCKARRTRRACPWRNSRREFNAAADGFIARIQCEQVGLASLVLGGGRNKQDDVIDHAVGLELHKKLGDAVQAGEPVATVHYNDPARLPEALRLLQEAYNIGPKPPGEASGQSEPASAFSSS